MAYSFTVDESPKISLAPATLIEEIAQNVSMIVTTVKNTVPLFRDFGVSAMFLDKPANTAEAILIADILEAIEAYEPRAKVIKVSFARSEMTGKLSPNLELGINAE